MRLLHVFTQKNELNERNGGMFDAESIQTAFSIAKAA